jgi:hypothetical protein
VIVAVPTVIYDANVLYPAPLRDLLIRVAMAGLVRARWTDAIHEEWIRNLLRNRPDLGAEQLKRTRHLMDRAVPDCLVIGYEGLIDGLRLPDSDDRHVLAAAIHAKATLILTLNARDFPRRVLAPHGVMARHPDEFLVALFEEDPDALCQVVRAQRAALSSPAQAAEKFLEILRKIGLAKVSARLATRRDQL